MSNANKQGLFAALAANPGDLCSWAALHDLLDDEGEPDVVLRVCRQAGTWIGSRADWEREGPVVVDRVPVARVWVQDMAPLTNDTGVGWSCYGSVWHAEDIPGVWVREKMPESFATPAAAQAWLTQIALDYARLNQSQRDAVRDNLGRPLVVVGELEWASLRALADEVERLREENARLQSIVDALPGLVEAQAEVAREREVYGGQ